MRTLKFIVDDQIMVQDPNCDFTNLVPGSEDYVQLEFSFSPQWRNTAKVAAFYSNMGSEYPPRVLEDGKSCRVPSEALERRIFKVKVVGKGNGTKLTTNKVTVYQNGGKA